MDEDDDERNNRGRALPPEGWVEPTLPAPPRTPREGPIPIFGSKAPHLDAELGPEERLRRLRGMVRHETGTLLVNAEDIRLLFERFDAALFEEQEANVALMDIRDRARHLADLVATGTCRQVVDYAADLDARLVPDGYTEDDEDEEIP